MTGREATFANKMAAAGEQASELNNLDSLFSPKDEQLTALEAFMQKKDVFDISTDVTCFVALIGCRSIQLRPQAFMSVSVGNSS